MRANPDLATADDLTSIVEPHGLIRSVDALPVRHVLALVTNGRRWIGLHWIDYPRWPPDQAGEAPGPGYRRR